MAEYTYKQLGIPLDLENWEAVNENFKNISKDAKVLQSQINKLVIDGDSSPEAAQARVGVDGRAYNTLKERIDNENAEVYGELLTKADKEEVADELGTKRSVLTKLELEDVSSTFLGAITGNTTVNLLSEPQKNSIDRYKYDKAILTANLFDKDKAHIGKYVSPSNGTLVDSSSRITSDYIPVDPSITYASKNVRNIAYYDVNKIFISGQEITFTNNTKQTFAPPANARFLRFSFYDYQLEDGIDLKTFAEDAKWEASYIPHRFKLKDFEVTNANLPNHQVLHHIEQTSNIFNKYTVNRGKDVSRSTGLLADNANRNTSDFIAVEPNQQYYIARVINCVFYNAQKQRIDALDLVANPVDQIVTTPADARYIRVSFYTGEVTINSTQMVVKSSTKPQSYIPYGFYLDDLFIKKENLSFELNQGGISFDGESEGRKSVEAFLWEDLTFVGEELWAFQASDYSNVSEGVGAIHIFDGNLEYRKRLLHNFGHCNTISYNAGSDSLIFGNGSGFYDTDGVIYVIQGVQAWSELAQDTMLNIDSLPAGSRLTKIEVFRDFGDKVNVLWGDDNLGLNNICYVLSDDGQSIRKLLLGKGSNVYESGGLIAGSTATQYNGTYKVLQTWTHPEIDVLQGGTYYNGYLYMGMGHGGLWVERFKLHADGTVTTERKQEQSYRADGTPWPYYASEGVAIRNGMIYHSTFGSAGTKFIHKYRVF